jgi:L-ascorbate metabolism protein UlaG (beta-lactamase superfamily)
MSHLNKAADAILVTHAHFDHLLDAPNLMRLTHARLIAGPTAVALVQSLGISATHCLAVKPGAVQRLGPWTIRVFAAQHDRLLGSVPFPNKEPKLSGPPVRPSDWSVGEPLAFVIEAHGKRIYIESGGVPGAPLDRTIGQVDLAIIGVALSDSRRRFPEVVRQLHPRYVLPSHQDDFFQPFDRGFVFGPLTSFSEVVRTARAEHLPGRLVLMDYFQPWTIR